MANNYQSRIELIVDDIAKDNVEFKAKTIAQQNAQKTDMILSISKSIAGLNDVGQNLVLNDIEKEVRENRIDIIDSSGNINVTELTKFTSTLVKAKIDEFERQGINLRLDSQIARDSKISVTETVLSVAVISEMADKYDLLSSKDRAVIIDNWENLTNKQRSYISHTLAKEFRSKAKSAQDSVSEQTYNNLADASEMRGDFFDELDGLSDAEIEDIDTIFEHEYGKNYTDLKKENARKSIKEIVRAYYAKMSQEDTREAQQIYEQDKITKEQSEAANRSVKREVRFKAIRSIIGQLGKDFYNKDTKEQEEIIHKYIEHIEKQKLEDKSSYNQIDIITEQLNDSKAVDLQILNELSNKTLSKDYIKQGFSEPIGLRIAQEQNLGENYENALKTVLSKKFKEYLQDTEPIQNISTTTEQSNEISYGAQQSKQVIKISNKFIEDKKSKNLTSQQQQLQEEIKQIPSELAKAGYSQEEIKESLTKYKEMLEIIPITEYEGKTSAEIIDFFQNGMDPPQSKSDEILVNILAKNDFGGHLQQYLTSPELLQGTFIPSLTAEIEQLERISDQEFNRHYRGQEVDLDASAAEASKEQQGRSERTSNVQEEPQEETPTDTTGQADSSTAEHKPQDEIETPPVQGTESFQNMALVEQDNSFIGKIKRVLANMKDKKGKDSKKGFFSRLKESVKDVFGNSDNRYENEATESVTTQPQAVNEEKNDNIWKVSQETIESTNRLGKEAAYQKSTQDKSSKIIDKSSSSKDEEEPMVP